MIKAINPELKRRMALTWGMGFAMLAPIQFKVMFADHSMIPSSVAFLIGPRFCFQPSPLAFNGPKEKPHVELLKEPNGWKHIEPLRHRTCFT
jgi:hypothetical protein